jgi:type IV secretion system protein VirD4
MVSRQETPRSLLTPGEFMPLPPGHQLVLMSGYPAFTRRLDRLTQIQRLDRNTRVTRRWRCSCASC